MTPEQFVFWLRGYAASIPPGAPTYGDWKRIVAALATVGAAKVDLLPPPVPYSFIQTVMDAQKRKTLEHGGPNAGQQQAR